MTDLVVRQDQQAPHTHQASADLVAWAQAASAAHQLAVPLCETDFVPAHFRKNPNAAVAAILYGAEAGLSPLQALQGVYVISGRPAMYARTMAAVVLSKGHQMWTEDLTDSRAIVCAQRRGSDKVERVVWTMDRAKKAGYTKNAKYQTDPQSMLLARAQSDAARRVAPDALLGMAYSVEELQDDGGTLLVHAEDGQPAQRRTARRARPAQPEAAEPDLDPTPEPAAGEPEPASIPDPITQPQMRKMQALFGEKGITDRDERLAYVAGVIGRDVTTSSDLSKAEAGEVIDRLESWTPEPPMEPDNADETPADAELWPPVAGQDGAS